MFDPAIISLILSGVIGALQVFTFFDNRSVRKEQSLNTFAKADLVKTDLDAIRTSIDGKINHLFNLVEEQDSKITSIGDEINTNSTDIAVIKERIANEKEFINKLDEKLDRIIDFTCDDRHKP
jgi:peptidoglycan hydrolase CwlO-like protein